VVSLTASPGSGWEVGSWWGTSNNGSTSTTNSLTMSSSSHSAGVNYLEPICQPKNADCSSHSDCCSGICKRNGRCR
jgi:hypothetical protein